MPGPPDASDTAAEMLVERSLAADRSAIAESTSPAEAWAALDRERARYSAAWWALQSVWEAAARVDADLVPPLCAALPAWAAVGIRIDVGALCDRPRCWGTEPPPGAREDRRPFRY